MFYRLLSGGVLVALMIVATPALAKIVFQSNRDGNHEIYVINDDGSGERRLTYHPTYDSNPRWSPDGKQITFTRQVPGEIIKVPGEEVQTYTYDVFVMNADGSNPRNLTNNPSINGEGSWSPDGHHIAFTSSRSGAFNIYLITLESGVIEQLTHNGGVTGADWAPNGRHFTYEQSAGSFWKNIHLMTADGMQQQPLLPPHQGLIIRSGPRFSPDSKRILYVESTYKDRVVRDAKGKTIFLDVMSSQLRIQQRHTGTNQRIKLPKNWRPGGGSWMANGKEILLAADEIGLITKEHGNYDLYRYHLNTGHIRQITDHPAADTSPHWVEGALSVSKREKLATQWARLKNDTP